MLPHRARATEVAYKCRLNEQSDLGWGKTAALGTTSDRPIKYTTTRNMEWRDADFRLHIVWNTENGERTLAMSNPGDLHVTSLGRQMQHTNMSDVDAARASRLYMYIIMKPSYYMVLSSLISRSLTSPGNIQAVYLEVQYLEDEHGYYPQKTQLSRCRRRRPWF